MARISQAQRNAMFGQPGKVDRLAVLTPWGIWVSCHVLIRDVFLDACNAAFRHPWKPQRIDSYANRPVRGSSSPSLHGYALAFDFFATGPNVVPPGGVWNPHNGVPAAFAKCFEDRGFFWGANFSRVDVPHIEWAQGKPSATPPPAPARDDFEELLMAIAKDDTDAVAAWTRTQLWLWLGRGPASVAEFADHVKRVRASGADAYIAFLTDSPEGKSYRKRVDSCINGT